MDCFSCYWFGFIAGVVGMILARWLFKESSL